MNTIGYILLFAFLFVLSIILRSPQMRGRRGESVVARVLTNLPSDRYFVLNNVILKTGNGLSQIDHVVVSVYGIFVIETKNYSGWIFGSETNPYWTQTIYGYKHKFYSPILQNKGHVSVLKTLLSQFGDIPIIPIVAFSGKCDLKNRHVFRSEVIYFSELRKTILNYSLEAVDSNMVHKIYEYIQSNNQTSKESRNQQTNYAKMKSFQYETSLNQGRCPKCGGELVLRHGKYGQFYGCSNYPKCKYTIR